MARWVGPCCPAAPSQHRRHPQGCAQPPRAHAARRRGPAFCAQDGSHGGDAGPLPGRVSYAALPNNAAPTVSAAPRGPPSYVDIDQHDAHDPMACTPYIMDIYTHLRDSEALRRPATTYMESVQTDINPVMRSILVDWLVEVGQEYRLTSDTLFLSVALADRFLSLVDVRRNRLQLVGITCMLVAAKYEEIYAPQVEEFCYITDNTYTREQVRARLGCVCVCVCMQAGMAPCR